MKVGCAVLCARKYLHIGPAAGCMPVVFGKLLMRGPPRSEASDRRLHRDALVVLPVLEEPTISNHFQFVIWTCVSCTSQVACSQGQGDQVTYTRTRGPSHIHPTTQIKIALKVAEATHDSHERSQTGVPPSQAFMLHLSAGHDRSMAESNSCSNRHRQLFKWTPPAVQIDTASCWRCCTAAKVTSICTKTLPASGSACVP